MALPSTPPISLSQIQSEVGLAAGASLIDCLNASYLADKSLPVAMTRFLGYEHLSAPGVPTSLAAAQSTPTSGINLTWAAPSSGGPVDTYHIEKSVNGGAYSEIGTVTGATFAYNDAAVSFGNTYTYRLRASNASGYSGYTATDSVDYINVPGTPATLSATPIYGSHMFIEWSAPSSGGPVETYHLERKLEFGGTWGLVSLFTDGSTSYSDPHPIEGDGNYYYRIRAENNMGNSAWRETLGVSYNS